MDAMKMNEAWRSFRETLQVTGNAETTSRAKRIEVRETLQDQEAGIPLLP
jgi:hypothetical protein